MEDNKKQTTSKMIPIAVVITIISSLTSAMTTISVKSNEQIVNIFENRINDIEKNKLDVANIQIENLKQQLTEIEKEISNYTIMVQHMTNDILIIESDIKDLLKRKDK